MKTLVALLLGLIAIVGGGRADERNELDYRVQLVRGTNSERPEDPKWKPVSAKLAKRLSPVFRWKNYWAVDQRTVKVANNKPARAVLSNDRILEIQLVSPDISEIRLYRKGALVRKSRQSAQARFSIMGGDGEQGQCWFVVVRNIDPQ
jgi:hypothetical protein